MRILIIILGVVFCFGVALPVCAQNDSDHYIPTRYGAALLAGKVYDPDDIGLLLVQGQALVDYDRIFWHAAPESLRLKFEINGGLTTDGRHRALLSFNVLAFNYLNSLQISSWVPSVEAGIGLIYTDFQVKEQGSRINFNPQLGVGVEHPLQLGGAVTVGLRLHHISNGNLLKDNRGVNSALLIIGYMF